VVHDGGVDGDSRHVLAEVGVELPQCYCHQPEGLTPCPQWAVLAMDETGDNDEVMRRTDRHLTDHSCLTAQTLYPSPHW